MKNLEEQLAKVLEKSISLAEKTGEFAIEQAPELLKQFYAWHISSHIMGILLGVSIALLGKYLISRIGYDEKRPNTTKVLGRYVREYETQDLGIVLIFAFSLLLSSWAVIYNIYHLTYLLIAPKLYLIEYFVHKL